MIIHRTLLAAAFALAVPIGFATIGAHADELQPIVGRTISLGEVSGVVYYTVERDGFRIVATLAQGEAGTPVRIEAVLAPGQSVGALHPARGGCRTRCG